jgi:hypothetical protein
MVRIKKIYRDVRAESALQISSFVRFNTYSKITRKSAPGIFHHVDCVSGRLLFKRIGTLFPQTNVVQAAAEGM